MEISAFEKTVKPPAEFIASIGRICTPETPVTHCESIPWDDPPVKYVEMPYEKYIHKNVSGKWDPSRDSIRFETTYPHERDAFKIVAEHMNAHRRGSKMRHAVVFQCGTVVMVKKGRFEFDMWECHRNFPGHRIPNAAAKTTILRQNCLWWKHYKKTASPEHLSIVSTALFLLCTREYPMPGEKSYCDVKFAWTMKCACCKNCVAACCQLWRDQRWIFTVVKRNEEPDPMFEFRSAEKARDMRRYDHILPRIKYVIPLRS